MPPAERKKVLHFLALFFMAIGLLSTLLWCGTEYWLLAAETCWDGRAFEAEDPVRIFHEGLFWRCSFPAASHEFSMLDLWISNQPPSKLCQSAFLFPFPAFEGVGPDEPSSAIVFRTFWSIFLVGGVAGVTAGGFTVICAGPLTNHTLLKVGGAFQMIGGVFLLVVGVMYVTWVDTLDTLERFALLRRGSGCPSFHLHVQHGPSFLLAPVAVFFSLLAGLLHVLLGRSPRPPASPPLTSEERGKTLQLPEQETDL